MKPPVFKNYVEWYGKDDSPQNNAPALRKWLLERLPYEIVVKGSVTADLRDIGEITLGPWSAYSDVRGIGRYFFEEEVDAMAFKLKFL